MSDNIFAPPTADVNNGPPVGGDSDIAISDAMIHMLEKTRPWVKFISIMGYVVACISVLAAISLWTFGRNMFKEMGESGIAFSIFIGGVYLVFGLLYLIPSSKLWDLAASLGQVETDPVLGFEESIESQRVFWKTAGIMILVSIGLYFCLIIVALVFTSMMPAPTS